MEPTDPPNLRVEQAFGAWSHKQQRLQEASQTLERAMDIFAHQEGPDPEQLKEQVEQLRAVSDVLFWELLAAVRAARASGGR